MLSSKTQAKDPLVSRMPKYLGRRLATPGILVFKEKHGNRYFVCNNEEEYCRASMKVLKDRSGEKHCWYFDDPDDLDTGITRAKEIIAANDNVAAYVFLHSRSDWEYEDMEIEYGEEF